MTTVLGSGVSVGTPHASSIPASGLAPSMPLRRTVALSKVLRIGLVICVLHFSSFVSTSVALSLGFCLSSRTDRPSVLWA